jgi:hypothetical protein
MDNNIHLSEESIAIAAEAMATNTFEELDPAIRQHIADCDQCAHEVQMVAELLEASTEKPSINLSSHSTIDIKSARSKRSTPVFWIAASISVAIIASTVFIWFENEEATKLTPNLSDLNELEDINERTFTQETIDSLENVVKPTIEDKKTEDNNTKDKLATETELKKKDLLLAYQAHPQMENLFNRFKDDASLRGFEIEVNTEATLKVQADTFKLNWNNPEAFSLTVEIFNNKAEKIIELESHNNSCQVLSPKSKGLYYWKLLDEDFELIFCGKIIIE